MIKEEYISEEKEKRIGCRETIRKFMENQEEEEWKKMNEIQEEEDKIN